MIHHLPIVHHAGIWLLAALGLRLLFWVGIATLIILGVRALMSKHASMDPALGRLRERLASGEISPEDYEKLRQTLGR